MAQTVNFEIRRAGPADVDDIAAAHLDSIRSIGARFYDETIVRDWADRVTSDLYLKAMARGEVFWIAVDVGDGRSEVLGFSSHRIDGHQHGTSVYVRGRAARLGIGTALFRSAEASALAAGAAGLVIDASLSAVEFYKANGFEEVGRGTHQLASARAMACVFMRKSLADSSSRRETAAQE